MDNTEKTVTARSMGPLTYLVFLLRGPLLVTLGMVIILVDLVIPGSMKEALRYALLDRSLWYQFAVIGVALLLACAAVRFSGVAIIELVAPGFSNRNGAAGKLPDLLPRLLALALGFAVAWPLIQIFMDWNAFQSGIFESKKALAAAQSITATTRSVGMRGEAALAARYFALFAAGVYLLIAILVAVVAPGPRPKAAEMRDPPFLMRLGFALLPLALAGMFAAAVMGVSRPGIAHNALERYSSAVIGTLSDARLPNEANRLWRWVYASGTPDQARRYNDYIDHTTVISDDTTMRTYVGAKYPVSYVLAMLLSLFAACYALRLAVAAFLDLLFPNLGTGGRWVQRWRRLLPPLASTGLGVAVALQVYVSYFLVSPPVTLAAAERPVAWIIMATYVAVGLAASFGSGSRFTAQGPWRESKSVGRRFAGAVRRLAALSPFWRLFISGLILLGLVFFFLFANLRWVEVPQWIGPVGIILLWGATLAAALFVLSYLAHATRIPFLAIFIVAALTFAGFNINDNHGVRILADAGPAPGEPIVTGRTFELAKWMASRPDRDKYDHYPVFLVATEGGGIRAAYFTATVLAALQERCPAFALHTIAMSGVSGGSLGASVFAGLAADDGRARQENPGCDLAGVSENGPMVAKARQTLAADLLSPLLGATLFPDAFQRVLPFPIDAFDRSRALEYAVEESWRSASLAHGGNPDTLASSALGLYTPHNAVPNLLLNTTEASNGEIVPYTTADILKPVFRDQAQIDNGNLDCGHPVVEANCVMPLPQLKVLPVSAGSEYPVALSTAAIVSARFPYLTPAGTMLDPKNEGRSLDSSGGHYVDGGYFENSGTFLLSAILQNLIGEQLCLQKGPECTKVEVTGLDESTLKAARNAVFIVIVIQSEPCTRQALGTSCQEAKPASSGHWSELLSPLRALLSTRESRATYSSENLRSVAALIENFRAAAAPAAADLTEADDGISCKQTVCTVTLRFLNRPNTEIPLTWLLSNGARHYMDRAVNGLERADVRTYIPRASVTDITDTYRRDRVLGSYRRVLCLLAARNDVAGTPCTPNATVAPEEKVSYRTRGKRETAAGISSPSP